MLSSLVGIVLRNAIAVLLALTLLPWLMSWLGTALPSSFDALPYLGWLVGGVLVAVLWLLWRRPNWLIHTTLHELSHALVCLLLGVKVRAFQATDGAGGAVIHNKTDALRTTLIALAPYTLPIVLGPLLLVRWYVGGTAAAPVFSGLCAAAYVHHLHGLYHNVRINFWGKQADLSRAGKGLSVVVIACALIAVTLWLIVQVRSP